MSGDKKLREIAYVIAAAQRKAKETGKAQYVYTESDRLLVGGKSEVVAFQRGNIIAKCYPGGRMEMMQVLE